MIQNIETGLRPVILSLFLVLVITMTFVYFMCRCYGVSKKEVEK